MGSTEVREIDYKLTWPIRHEAMYPDLGLEVVKLENDQEGTHFGLFDNDELLSVISLFREGSAYQFRKFATLSHAQGKGCGTLLLQYIIDTVRAFGASKLWCNSRRSAIHFYSKFGFLETDQVSRKFGIDFVIMELQLSN